MVAGMRCAACERALARGLAAFDGVLAARAERQAQRVVVDYDPQRVDEQAVREYVALCGYTPR
jgi:cation transport ATPase